MKLEDTIRTIPDSSRNPEYCSATLPRFLRTPRRSISL